MPDRPVADHTTTPRVAALTAADADALLDIDQWAFAYDDEGFDGPATLSAHEWDRTFGAFHPAKGDHQQGEREQLVGIFSTYSVDLPVPGGSLPCGGLTWVGVHPGHRRRGVLTALIGAHLDDVRRRGEPVAALNASEPTIYGRFGFGVASRQVRLTLPRGADLLDVPGTDEVALRVERADADRHAELAGECYEAARSSRPGMVSRTQPHTRLRFYDPPKWRHGGESLRIVVAESSSGGTGHGSATGAAPSVRGYALFRRQEKWTGLNPEGQAHVKELVARDPAAARALWGFLLDLDLMGSVATDSRALDDPLLNLLRNPRAGSPTLGDGIWVRLVDLPTALTSRRYTTDVDVVIEVADRQLPENAGRWRLSSRGAEVSCQRTDDPPAFSADVRELGSAYLGSITLGALASAGQIQVHDDDATAAASAAWSWPVASYCGWVF